MLQTGAGSTMIVTLSVAVHPYTSVTVSVRIYVPSGAGPKIGSSISTSFRYSDPAPVHSYVNDVPEVVAAIWNVSLAHSPIIPPVPASAVGAGSTMMVTLSVAVHPYAS